MQRAEEGSEPGLIADLRKATVYNAIFFTIFHDFFDNFRGLIRFSVVKDRATRSDFYTVVERRRRPPKSCGSGAVWRIIHLGGLSGVLDSGTMRAPDRRACTDRTSRQRS